MRNSIEAYLDNFGLVNVYIDHHFFGGKTERFYMKNSQNKYFECVIRSFEVQNDFTKYELVIPTDYCFGEKYFITDSHGYTCEIAISALVQTSQFKDMFNCDKETVVGIYAT